MLSVRKYFAVMVVAAISAFGAIAANAADANVAGTWTMSVESAQGARESTLTLTQKGSAITGTMKGARGENPITGTVAGNEVKFTANITMGDRQMAIEYAGKVEGGAITGTMKTPRGESNFTAKKQ